MFPSKDRIMSHVQRFSWKKIAARSDFATKEPPRRTSDLSNLLKNYSRMPVGEVFRGRACSIDPPRFFFRFLH
jgi:hypothetical protein